MKKQIILLAASLLLSTVAIFANQVPMNGGRLIVRIEKSTEPYFLTLRLANLQKQRTLVELRDISGNTWFSQYVSRKNGFAKNLNLKQLPDGGYFVSITHKDATVVQFFTLSEGVLSLDSHLKMELPSKPEKALAKGR